MTIQEQRKEERRIATGGVRVKFTDPEPLEIDGRLIDVSANGFRMAHDCQSLRSGQVVEFKHVEAAGSAQIMWNRIMAGGVETGFRVVT